MGLAGARRIERIEWSKRERDRLKLPYTHEVKQAYLSQRLLKKARVAIRKSNNCVALTSTAVGFSHDDVAMRRLETSLLIVGESPDGSLQCHQIPGITTQPTCRVGEMNLTREDCGHMVFEESTRNGKFQVRITRTHFLA